ncbi:hypothetical protein THAOC_21455 [Thalassiosira oceanica]|uniref:Uncharacterized protein n=1 Tax=Thalassiosira oceanica TaxID=159749 RepID=K0SIT9_THAOC|nr:hypothetical protein THAOC_21455 [Thalassiosira oceanica]|eukprot:EJK58422.1 hypothetical protein THAOC_21455 [Thalassiosira oceanica]
MNLHGSPSFFTCTAGRVGQRTLSLLAESLKSRGGAAPRDPQRSLARYACRACTSDQRAEPPSQREGESKGSKSSLSQTQPQQRTNHDEACSPIDIGAGRLNNCISAVLRSEGQPEEEEGLDLDLGEMFDMFDAADKGVDFDKAIKEVKKES